MKASLVKRARLSAGESVYEMRPFVHPLIIAICGDCAFPAVAVSQEAADAAVWEHVAAIHLPSRLSRETVSGTD